MTTRDEPVLHPEPLIGQAEGLAPPVSRPPLLALDQTIRVLIATPELERAGAERVVVDQAVHLAARGHAVAVASSGGALESELTSAGVPHLRVGPARPGPAQLLLLAYRLASAARMSGAEVINTHGLRWAVAALLGRYLRFHRSPVVTYTMHGPEHRWFPAIPVLARGVDAVFSVCEANRRRLVGAGFDGAKVRTLTNGVRVSAVAPAERARVAARRALGLEPGRRPVLGVVGRLLKLKGIDVLLAAAPRIRQAFPGVLVLVAGDGPMRARLETLSGLRVPEMFRFLGVQSDMTRIYEAMDLLVLASREEACPMVILEAGGHAVATVATRVGGVPEIVEEGVSGWMVSPENPDALAAAVIAALSNPDGLQRAGSAARRRVVEFFPIDVAIDRLESELYRLRSLRGGRSTRSLTIDSSE